MRLFYKPDITDDEYKLQQTAFVSDQIGTNYIFLMANFIDSVLLNFIQHLLYIYYPSLKNNFLLSLLIDSTISLPAIMIPMFFPSLVYPLCVFLIVLFIVLMMKHPQDNQPTEYPVYTTGFVELRSLIITWTLIAILAVDFNIFPRFHVKSEFYGISLMDIGVGAVVIVGGVAGGFKTSKIGYLKNIRITIVQSLMYFFFGFCRILIVICTNYQQHVGEYGIHMNFFFVLGLVQVLAAFLRTKPKYALFVSVGLIVVYEIALNYFDLYKFSQDESNRMNNLITMNKEGLLSVFGYTAVQIGSIAIGYYYSLSGSKKYRTKLDFIILFISLGMFVLYEIISPFIQPCRPLINFTYYLAVMSQMMICYAIEDLVPMYLPIQKIAPSNGMSLNQLPLFLIANLATGIINCLVYTLYVPVVDSIIFVCVYTVVLRIMAYVLGYYRIVLKMQSLQIIFLKEDFRTPEKIIGIPSLIKWFKSKRSSNKKEYIE